MSILIKSISVTIGDSMSHGAHGFDITLDGQDYHLGDFNLTQSLLSPGLMSFTLQKGPAEAFEDTRFSVCGEIVGKPIELQLFTENTEKVSLKVQNEKTADLIFRGVITAAYASRYGSVHSVSVQAASWEALLMDSETCRSYEGMKLDDIVASVTEDYDDRLEPDIQSRWQTEIPYCVQYNETNYAFLQRLARRYGEWLYNDGERLVFGDLQKGTTVQLNYPSQDIPSYSIDARMQHIAFSHVASSYNSSESSVKEGIEEMQRPYNALADSLFAASQNCFSKPTLQNLHSGGYANEDGREAVLNIAAKSKARGAKAGMLTYSGTTYCTKIKLASTLVIVDNYISDAATNQKSHVNQDEILIIELSHSFSADGEYSNRFTGIPAACDYPPYADSDVYPVCPSCRAKVTDNEDPLGLGRVRVQFDWQAQLDDEMMTPWLRMAQPYAGGGKGFSFIPEIGEEVMIDFEGGNAERPYVKGTLYNGVGNPDEAWLRDSNSSNQVKAIRTRNGHTIEIHDEGDDGYIRIYDNEKENYILTFSTDEKLIKLESTGNIELYAQNDIIMHAGHDINASADNDIFIAASHDMQRTADNDIREHAGNDRTTSIDRNDSLTVESNQFVNVHDNKDEKVDHKLQVTAENIRVEAEKKLLEYSETHHQKASGTMAINAERQIDIKAQIVKVQ